MTVFVVAAPPPKRHSCRKFRFRLRIVVVLYHACRSSSRRFRCRTRCHRRLRSCSLVVSRGRRFLVIYSLPTKCCCCCRCCCCGAAGFSLSTHSLRKCCCCWLLLFGCLLIPGRIRGETSHPTSCKIIPGDFQKPYLKKKWFLGILALAKNIGF